MEGCGRLWVGPECLWGPEGDRCHPGYGVVVVEKGIPEKTFRSYPEPSTPSLPTPAS